MSNDYFRNETRIKRTISQFRGVQANTYSIRIVEARIWIIVDTRILTVVIARSIVILPIYDRSEVS